MCILIFLSCCESTTVLFGRLNIWGEAWLSQSYCLKNACLLHYCFLVFGVFVGGACFCHFTKKYLEVDCSRSPFSGIQWTLSRFKFRFSLISGKISWTIVLNILFPFSFLKGLQLYSVGSLACLIFHTFFSDPFYSFLIFILLFSCLFFKRLLLEFHSNTFSPEHFIIYS